MRNKKFKLSTISKHLIQQFLTVRAYKQLVGYGTLTLRRFSKKLVEIIPDSNTFDTRVLLKWERKRALQYSIPQKETRCIKLFEKAQPHVRKYKLSHIDELTSDEVFKADLDTVKNYCKVKNWNHERINYTRLDDVMMDISNKLKSHPGRLLTFDDAIDRLPKETSSCYPLYEKKGSLNAINDAHIKLRKLQAFEDAGSMLNLLNTQLVTIFHRFTTRLKRSPNGIERKTKIRQVFGVPFLITILEQMLFGDTVQQWCEKNILGYFSYALTRPEISRQVTNIRNEAKRTKSYILCGDISQIDASITVYQLWMVINLISRNYDLNNWWQELLTAYTIWISYTPILWSSRTVSWTNGGNITGSYLTSVINSVSVLIALSYSYKTIYGKTLTANKVKILGDDFILIIDNKDDVKLLKQLLKDFNLKLNESKSLTVNSAQGITYLGFIWDLEGNPYNDELWYIARICFPERFLYIAGYNRILQRSASILFQLANGKAIFDKVFVGQIKAFSKLLREGHDPDISYMDKSGKYYYVTLPYSKIRELGWKAF